MSGTRPTRLVVVGNGMATARLLDELLRRDGLRQFRITVFAEEPQGSYNRILLHRLLTGGTLEDIVIKPPRWYAEHGIDFLPTVVTAVDRDKRQVVTNQGLTCPFDVAVLATGSRPLIPPLAGLQLDDGSWCQGVVPYRTVQDCERLRPWIEPGRRVVVLGGGLLGLEVAKTLTERRMLVTVVQAAPWLMNRQLDATAARLLQQILEQMGLSFRIGIHAVRLTSCTGKAVDGVVLSDGTTLPADLVVLACGVSPRIELAVQAGLTVRHGIVVDDQLRTSDPHIYAVGECAEHRGIVYGIVAPIYEQCSVLADVLCGVRPQARYSGSSVYTRLKVAGVDVASMGIIEPCDERDEVLQVLQPQRRIYCKLIVRHGRLAGAILVGDTTAAASLSRRLIRGDLLPHNRLDLLASPYRGGLEEDEEVICHCYQLSQQQVQQAIRQGCHTLAELSSRTGAGTGCGGCRGRLTHLLLRSMPTAEMTS